MSTTEYLERGWENVPRSKLFDLVIGCVDFARSESEQYGDDLYVELIEEVMFPFLEAEEERAALKERLASR